MKIKVSCICGTSFELDENFLNAKGLVCPNCENAYPEKLANGIRSMLKGNQDLEKAFAEEDCWHYEIEL